MVGTMQGELKPMEYDSESEEEEEEEMSSASSAAEQRFENTWCHSGLYLLAPVTCKIGCAVVLGMPASVFWWQEKVTQSPEWVTSFSSLILSSM